MVERSVPQGSIVFVESNTSGTGRLFIERTLALGWTPVLLSSAPQRYPFSSDPAVRVVRVDTSDIDAVASACSAAGGEHQVRGVWSSSEYFVQMAAAAARRLGLAGNRPDDIERCRNKHSQRRILVQSAIAVPRFVLIHDRASYPEGWGAVVVKPLSGSGSVGVTLCTHREMFAAAVDAAFAAGADPLAGAGARPAGALVEEFIDGPEFSVELFSLQAIGVTAKHLGALPRFVEVGHDFPAPIDAGTRDALVQASVRAAAALNLTWGPLHVELRLTDDGPVVIEVNPRLAGGFIPLLVERALGIDLIAETLRAVAGAEPVLRGNARGTASIRFLLASGSGVLEAMPLDQVLDASDGEVAICAYRKAGERVFVHGDFRDRIGHVLALASTPDATGSLAEEVARRLQKQIVVSAQAGQPA